MFRRHRQVAALIIVLLLGLVKVCNGQDQEPPHVAFLSSMKEKFDDMGPRSKFAVGAAGGFVVTRIALGTAMTAIKIGALAYVT